jgi:hypothetical protein
LPIPTPQDTKSSPDLHAFVRANGRLPRIGDGVSPWRYRGWLLLHVQLADFHSELPGRWQHYMRTLDVGHLLDESIPRLDFADRPGSDGLQMVSRAIDLIYHCEGSLSAFNRLIEWLGWGLAVTKEQPSLDDSLNEKLYRHFNLEPLLLQPHDYLGEILVERRGNGWNPNAFYPTPHTVVELMVQMTMRTAGIDDSALRANSKPESDSASTLSEEGRDPRLRTVCDPCVGTGRMLLHASNYSYCLYGCDIDPLVALITKINGAIYAPWLSFPFPQEILGIPVPPAPPARLPLPQEHQPPVGVPVFRTDDRGQGLLEFD